MSVLSIPVPATLLQKIDKLIEDGVAPNKAALARQALEFYAEEMAVRQVLQAEREVQEGKILTGDLDDIAAQL